MTNGNGQASQIWKWLIVIGGVVLLGWCFFGQLSASNGEQQATQEVTPTEERVTFYATETEEPIVLPTKFPTHTAYVQEISDYPECKYAALNRDTTCQISRAYCSYRPDVSGSPTFCNDAPYPGHSFTFLVWGEDWSDLDGRCIVVSGFVKEYRGKPEIEAVGRFQVVGFCD